MSRFLPFSFSSLSLFVEFFCVLRCPKKCGSNPKMKWNHLRNFPGGFSPSVCSAVNNNSVWFIGIWYSAGVSLSWSYFNIYWKNNSFAFFRISSFEFDYTFTTHAADQIGCDGPAMWSKDSGEGLKWTSAKKLRGREWRSSKRVKKVRRMSIQSHSSRENASKTENRFLEFIKILTSWPFFLLAATATCRESWCCLALRVLADTVSSLSSTTHHRLVESSKSFLLRNFPFLALEFKKWHFLAARLC